MSTLYLHTVIFLVFSKYCTCISIPGCTNNGDSSASDYSVGCSSSYYITAVGVYSNYNQDILNIVLFCSQTSYFTSSLPSNGKGQSGNGWYIQAATNNFGGSGTFTWSSFAFQQYGFSDLTVQTAASNSGGVHVVDIRHEDTDNDINSISWLLYFYSTMTQSLRTQCAWNEYISGININANSNTDTHVNCAQFYCSTITSCATSCPAGSYLSGYCTIKSDSVCVSCVAGKYLGTVRYQGSNVPTCIECKAGNYCQGGIQTSCEAGSYSVAAASACTPCPSGKFSSSGASECTVCPVLNYCVGNVITPCTDPPEGTYIISFCKKSSDIVYAPCTNTPPPNAHLMRYNYKSVCGWLCNIGYYSNAGETACIPCGLGQTTSTDGSLTVDSCVPCPQMTPICCGTGQYAVQSDPGDCSIWTCTSCTNYQPGVNYYASGANGCGAPLDNYIMNNCYTSPCPYVPIGYYSRCSEMSTQPPLPCSNAGLYSYYYNSSLALQTTNACPNALCPPCPAGKYTAAAVSGYTGGCANTVKVSDVAFTDRLAYGYNIGDSSMNYFVYCSASCPVAVANSQYYQNPSWQTAGQDPQLQSSSCSYFVCNTGFYKTSGGTCVVCPSDGCAMGSYRTTCSPDGTDLNIVKCQACINAKPDSPLAYIYGMNPSYPTQCLWACRKGAWYDSSRNMCVDCVARTDCRVGQYSDAACLTTDGITVAPSCLACEDMPAGGFTGPGSINDRRSCPFTCIYPSYFKVGYGCQRRSSITCPSWTRYVEGNSTSDNSCTPCDMTGIFAPYKAYMQQCVAGGYSSDACSLFESVVSNRYVMDRANPCSYTCAYLYSLQVDLSCGVCPTNTYYFGFGIDCLPCKSPWYTGCNTFAQWCLPPVPHEAATLPPSDACTASNPYPFYCNAGFYAVFNDISMTYACQSCGIAVTNASYIAPDPLNRYPCTTSFFSCNAGYYANITAFQCKACPVNMLVNAIWTPLDTWSINISDVPAQLNASCRVACNSGYFLDATARACVPCPPAYYCPGYTAKVLCNSTYYCPAFTVVPMKCPPGFYCSNTTSQVACPLGTYSNSGASACTQCTPQITACATGYFKSQTSFTSCSTYACMQCPQTAKPCCATGEYAALLTPGSCTWTCLSCSNAQAGVNYYIPGRADGCGAPLDSFNAYWCYTATCSPIPVGYYSLCSGAQDSAALACSNAPANSYYYSDSSLPAQTTNTCPTAPCQPCAVAGMYTPYSTLYKQNNADAVGGCANTVLASGSISDAGTGYNIKDPSRNTFTYCSAACPSVPNASYGYTPGADPQLQSSVCSALICNSGYYKSGEACLACSGQGCNNSFYRGVCAANGSDVNTVRCYACTNKPNSTLAYSYGLLDRSRTAGDANSCLWLCAAGAWYNSASNQCVTCAANTNCPAGQYSLAECMYMNGMTHAATCQSCAQIDNAIFTGAGKVNNGTSCNFTCNYGYFASGYSCRPWSVVPSCMDYWLKTVPGTATRDAHCAPCDTWLLYNAWGYWVDGLTPNMAQQCSDGNTTVCNFIKTITENAYEMIGECYFQCRAGYALALSDVFVNHYTAYTAENFFCRACPVNSYNDNQYSRYCFDCTFPDYTMCSGAAASCKTGDINAAAHAADLCSAPYPVSFYCNAGYYAAVIQQSLTYACLPCSNPIAHAAFVAPDPTNSNPCTSPYFVCNTGYYANQSAFKCLPCGAAPSNAILLPLDTSSLAMGNIPAQITASCHFICNGGYLLTGSATCTVCPNGTYSLPGGSSCLACAAGSSSGGGQSCFTCTPGTYSANGACVLCSAGTFSTANASTSCRQCSAGSFSAVGASACLACGAGSYSPTVASGFCQNCALGHYCPANSSQQTPCLAGYFCPNSTVQLLCGTTYYCPSSSTSAQKCDLGFYCPTSSTRTVCPAGSYCPEGSTTATPCPPGAISPTTAAAACSPCVAGTYSASTTACSPCSAATYSSATGANSSSTCQPCTQWGYATQASEAATSCTLCPSTCSALGTYLIQASYSSCTFQSQACANAAGGYYYVLDGSMCGAAASTSTCFTAPCNTTKAAVGFYRDCTTGMLARSGMDTIMPCTNAAPSEYYSAQTPIGSSLCPTSACPPCAAGVYSSAGCAGSASLSVPSTGRYCDSSCGVLNAVFKNANSSPSADPQSRTVACASFVCNTGYYTNGTSCLLCPTSDTCALGFYRPMCSADGSDSGIVACQPCSNKPGGLSALAVAYGNNGALGLSASCNWGCLVGSYFDDTGSSYYQDKYNVWRLYISSSLCIACTIPTCQIGYYPKADCLLYNFTLTAPYCDHCTYPGSLYYWWPTATIVTSGVVNDESSCAWQCNAGYFYNAAIRDCQAWSAPTCPSSTSSVSGTPTTDTTCAPCAYPTALYPLFADHMAACASGAYSDSACLSLTTSLSLAYLFTPNTCSFQCRPGYQLRGGICVQCPIHYYNPSYNGTCIPCISPNFTPCTVERTYCAPGIANQAGLLYTDTCASQRPPIYCKGGYMAVELDTFTLNTSQYTCAGCTNNPVFATYLAPDANNQCKSPNFTCALGFYQSLSTYTCASCGTLPSNAVSWVKTLAPTANASDAALQRAGSCNITCNAGYVITPAVACAACPIGTYAAANSTSCKPCPARYYCAAASASLALCPAGSFCPNSSYSLQCSEGYYCPQGSVNQTLCSPNFYCPAGTPLQVLCSPAYYAFGLCLPCAAGTYASQVNSSQCTPCSQGMYCAAAVSAQSLCAPGYYCPNSSYQILCPSAFVCPAGATRLAQCSAGYYLTNKTDVCAICPAGSYSATINATGCISCTIGNYCPAGSTQQAICPSGYYCVNSSSQSICSSGYSCPAGSTAQGSCSPGYYCTDASTPAQQCSPGTYCPAGSTAPTSCQQGYYCENTTSRVACVSGDYCPTTGLTGNVKCPQGSYCPSITTKTSCSISGAYCPAGSTAQALCTAGYYCPNTTTKILCSAGYYCAASVTKQTVCVSTYYCAPGSAAQNTTCPAGSFCANAGSIATCGAGTYCPVGSTAATNCTAGSYCPDTATKLACGAIPPVCQDLAVGGTISTDVSGYYVHQFLSDGAINFSSAKQGDVLVIGGGGGGGAGAGGGGGAGAVVYFSSYNFSAAVYNIVVGAGGAGVDYPANGGNGGDSSITLQDQTCFLAAGGGGGGNGNTNWFGSPGSAGGSSGGGGIMQESGSVSESPDPVSSNVVNGVSGLSPVTAPNNVFGYKGGRGARCDCLGSGGGGGAGGIGIDVEYDTDNNYVGNGGPGLYLPVLTSFGRSFTNISVLNASKYYIAGGGGGGGLYITYFQKADYYLRHGFGGIGGGGIGAISENYIEKRTSKSGAPGTGSGGGGSWYWSLQSGNGGSGLVLIRYPVQCSQAQATYCPAGSVANIPCSAGYYCSSNQNKILCSAGKYCPAGSSAQLTCKNTSYCPAGSWQDVCPAGMFIAANGTCTTCAAGTYTNSSGMTACLQCLSTTRSSFCSTCSSTAAYAPMPGATACLQCPLYALASLNGSTCLCAPGTLSLLYVSRLCSR